MHADRDELIVRSTICIWGKRMKARFHVCFTRQIQACNPEVFPEVQSLQRFISSG